jgi:hypothetical protein
LIFKDGLQILDQRASFPGRAQFTTEVDGERWNGCVV